MKKILLLTTPLILLLSCQNQSVEPTENSSWAFVANEGDFGASNGSISMISENGTVFETEALGDVVQSLEVYNDKLIVLINNSHKIKVYDISPNGLAMPGIEISTENSSPREMVIVDNNVYFTNWNSSDVKVLNLYTYNIDASIPVGVMPEGIETDGTKIWVANSGETTVSEIDISSRSVIATHEVGQGPQHLTKNGSAVYVSRTYYSDDWTQTYHGASKIDTQVLINNYGLGAACGGSILSYQTDTYRSFDGGLAKMNSDLDLNSDSKIGNFNHSQVYHIEENNGNIWFAITDYNNLNEVHVVDFNGNLVNSYEVGQTPGDFAFWEK